MSKDQKKTVELPVETVDNLIKSLEWIVASIHFWHLEKTYPSLVNLIDHVASDFVQNLTNLKGTKLEY